MNTYIFILDNYQALYDTFITEREKQEVKHVYEMELKFGNTTAFIYLQDLENELTDENLFPYLKDGKNLTSRVYQALAECKFGSLYSALHELYKVNKEVSEGISKYYKNPS